MAGSGTTGHAVLELNKEDGGNRKFILCTNNEVNGLEKEFGPFPTLVLIGISVTPLRQEPGQGQLMAWASQLNITLKNKNMAR